MKGRTLNKILAVLPFIFIVPFYTAFVVENLWNWFVAEAVHGTEISYWQALGFMMIVTLFTNHAVDERENWKRVFVVLNACVPMDQRTPVIIEAVGDERLSPLADIVGPVLGKAFLGTLLLAFGWAVHTFLM